MQWRKALAALVLLAIAAVLAAANVWFAAVRSTIPLQLDAVVSGKEVRHEKHPPKDDVCLLALGEQSMIHVDRAVFDVVAIGDRLAKTRWSTILVVGEKPLKLEYSDDIHGMVRAMPLVFLVFLAAAVWACRTQSLIPAD
jgi:hypothetical protein